MHKFIYDALAAIDTKIPAVSKIGTHSNAEKFSTISADFYTLDPQNTSAAKAVKVLATARQVFEGCPYQKTTTVNESNLGFTSASTETIVATTYDLSQRSGRTVVCKNLDLVGDVVKAGINEIKITTSEGCYIKYGSASVKFSQNVNTFCDMNYVKKQLFQIKGLDQDLVASLNQNGEQILGGSQSINLISSQPNFTDKIVLKYYQGSGDCPSGCISKHY